MNAEKLHQIVSELKEELDGLNIIPSLTTLRNHIQSAVSQPAQAAHQQKLSKAKKDLFVMLEVAASNSFNPSRRQVLEEIGGDLLFGNALKEWIEEIFSRNQITMSVALDEVNEILAELTAFAKAIDQLVFGFNHLKIDHEHLKGGECQVGYVIPRVFTDQKLGALNAEIKELDFILKTISEVAQEDEHEFVVHTISSSDYTLFIGVTLVVGKILLDATERILKNYKTILEIKKLKNEINAKGVPGQATEQIESFVNENMKKEISELVQETVENYGKNLEKKRKNELTSSLTICFNKIANRIDNGFNIEITVKELDVSKDKKAPTPQQIEFQSMNERSQNLQFIRNTGAPILQLKEAESKSERQKGGHEK